ncbi:MAG: hypothetical protein Q4G03_01570 [Planctomycetia bacterium]|nr:hypothetical protein [Planctomycetia bacterium]
MKWTGILAVAFCLTTTSYWDVAKAQPPRPGGRQQREVNLEYSAATTIETQTTAEKQSYKSDTPEQSALLVRGCEATLSDIEAYKSGAPQGRSDSFDFYGVNAAVLALKGAKLTLQGGKITTDAAYANALFVYGDATIIARDLTIETSQHNSGGVMATGGGTLEGRNLTITTQGGSSAAIRSDRGGGKMTLTGGVYTANGPGSPAIYSTADVTVNDAKLVSTKAEGVVIEGKNSITLNRVELIDDNTTLHGKSTTHKNVFIYQSFSGDAEVGVSKFNATDTTFRTKMGDSIYVTNTSCEINLAGCVFENEDQDGVFLRVQRGGWGRKGQNGGNVKMTLDRQTIVGDVYLDNISTLELTLTNGTRFTGAINAGNTAKRLNLVLDEDSVLELTDDCYVSSLVNANASGDNIVLNGHQLIVGAEEQVEDGLPEMGDDGNRMGPPDGQGGPGGPGGSDMQGGPGAPPQWGDQGRGRRGPGGPGGRGAESGRSGRGGGRAGDGSRRPR